MGRTITHLLSAAAIAVSSVTAIAVTATPAQAVADPKITCAYPINGELCLHVWAGGGRVAVSYKKIHGPAVRGILEVDVIGYGSIPVFHGAMQAGYTYSGYTDSLQMKPADCIKGALLYGTNGRIDTPFIC